MTNYDPTTGNMPHANFGAEPQQTHPPQKPGWSRNKKIAAVAGAVLVLGGIGAAVGATSDDEGSSSDRQAAPTTWKAPETTTSQPTTSAPTMSDREIAELAYIMVLDDAKVPYVSEDAAKDAGRAVCTELNSGVSVDELMMALALMDLPDLTMGQRGTILGAGVAAFCPEYQHMLG